MESRSIGPVEFRNVFSEVSRYHCKECGRSFCFQEVKKLIKAAMYKGEKEVDSLNNGWKFVEVIDGDLEGKFCVFCGKEL